MCNLDSQHTFIKANLFSNDRPDSNKETNKACKQPSLSLLESLGNCSMKLVNQTIETQDGDLSLAP